MKQVQYLLMKHGVSIDFYHQLSMIFPELPRSHKVYSYINDCIYIYICMYIASYITWIAICICIGSYNIYSYLIHQTLTIQIRKFKQAVATPAIMKTPGIFEGAQHNLHELLKEALQSKIVISYVAVCSYRCNYIATQL